MGVHGEDPGPDIVNPSSTPRCGAAVLGGADRVEVAAEAVFAGLQDADGPVGVSVADDVALGGDGIGKAAFFSLEQVRYDPSVIRVELAEAASDGLDLSVGEGVDGCRAVRHLVAATRARDEAPGVGGDDGHAVGVAEHPRSSGVGDGTFQQREEKSGGAGDDRGDGWKAELAPGDSGALTRAWNGAPDGGWTVTGSRLPAGSSWRIISALMP